MRHIRPQHILKLNHMRRRLNPVEVQRGYAVDMLEDPRKLPSHRLNLFIGEAQPGQLRNVQYLRSLNHALLLCQAATAICGASEPL